MIYFISSNNEYLKVGYTKNAKTLETRLKVYVYNSPYVITLLLTLPGSFELEQKFHREFVEVAVQGEWYPIRFLNAALSWFENPPINAVRIEPASKRDRIKTSVLYDYQPNGYVRPEQDVQPAAEEQRLRLKRSQRKIAEHHIDSDTCECSYCLRMHPNGTHSY